MPATRALALAAPLAALLAPRPGALGSAPRPFDVDKAHSAITFTARSRFVGAEGRFARWDADVALDPDAFEHSTVRITIDAASIDTQNGRRDTHLRSDDFFDVARYPTITFVSREVTAAGGRAGTITGDLTMHGVTRPVQVPVSVVTYADGRGQFRGAFPIARRDFGLSYNSRLNPIADTVRVQFEMSVAERK
jgi:polyisoprenoid-binding protein YceI